MNSRFCQRGPSSKLSRSHGAELVGIVGGLMAIEFDGELAGRATANFVQTLRSLG
jgi:hypothetical protein